MDLSICMAKKVLYLGLDPLRYQVEGEITHYPIIQIVPRLADDPFIKQSIANFALYTHVIITSRSTVKILFDYLLLANYQKQDWLGKVVIALGRATSSQLLSYGITPQIIAQEETAEGIISELKQIYPSLRQPFFFWPHSALSRPILANYLKQQGFRFQECILYETKVSNCLPLPSLTLFDEIIFTSPSTVDAFLTIFGQLPANKKLTPIGPVTASYLSECQNRP